MVKNVADYDFHKNIPVKLLYGRFYFLVVTCSEGDNEILL